MRVFISGPITRVRKYKRRFWSAKEQHESAGNIVLNPAALPAGLDEDRYLPICLAMIDACDAVQFLPGWEKSADARVEEAYAIRQGKIRIYPDGKQSRWKESQEAFEERSGDNESVGIDREAAAEGRE